MALASLKGSPGVTTCCVALCATWPREVLLVEADPAMGDLSSRWDCLDPAMGLVPLGAQARRQLTPGSIAAQIQSFGQAGEGGIEVLVGVEHHSQAIALESSWPEVMGALKGWKSDVLIDSGRLLPGLVGGSKAVLAGADLVIIVLRPSVEGALCVKNNLEEIAAAASAVKLLVVGEGYSPAEVQGALGLSVVGTLPDDPRGAAVASGRASPTRRLPLFSAAARLACDLAEELGPASEPEIADVEVPAGGSPVTSPEEERAPRLFEERLAALSMAGVGGESAGFSANSTRVDSTGALR